MPLPTLAVPTYELELPSSGKKIKYRPFLVKEEKLLLLATEGEDEKEIDRAVRETLKSCIQTRGVKIENLASFDLEYLFLKIRAAAAGEEIKMRVTCQDDNETQVNVTINVDDVVVDKPEGHSTKIMLTEDTGMVMKYPGVDQFVNITLLNKDLNSTEEVFNLVAKCVDQVFQGEEVWETSDMKLTEVVQFLEGMTQQQFEKVQEFFETMPVLRHQFEVTNPNTDKVSVFTLEGLQSFFG
tara:strand:+ start:1388 stop:2107 length:720 start_codon:yes stop_codon:yes gene_type:complete